MKCGFKYVEVEDGEHKGLRQCKRDAELFFEVIHPGRYVQEFKGWVATCPVHWLRGEESIEEEEFNTRIVVEG